VKIEGAIKMDSLQTQATLSTIKND